MYKPRMLGARGNPPEGESIRPLSMTMPAVQIKLVDASLIFVAWVPDQHPNVWEVGRERKGRSAFL